MRNTRLQILILFHGHELLLNCHNMGFCNSNVFKQQNTVWALWPVSKRVSWLRPEGALQSPLGEGRWSFSVFFPTWSYNQTYRKATFGFFSGQDVVPCVSPCRLAAPELIWQHELKQMHKSLMNYSKSSAATAFPFGFQTLRPRQSGRVVSTETIVAWGHRHKTGSQTWDSSGFTSK